jgi:ABC-type polysaccharide/polyol phosphate transport system, ATPase component
MKDKTDDIVIKVNNIHKSFKVYHDKGGTLKEKILFAERRGYELRQVLKDITFEVRRGEVIGLIGENGCGKSTTLKLLTRIMYPDSGIIEINGRVSSLLELGAGFHPDLTGRENIYTNASIFGLTKKEIDERLNDIIDFSELEDFIDNPVRTYSSGMYMRLAFSVAINVDADILMIDEILAVGDANFQAKCFEQLRRLKHFGKTIIIVTHDTGSIERLCTRAIWINNGELMIDGKPYEAVDRYLSYMNNKRVAELDRREHQETTSLQEKEDAEAKESTAAAVEVAEIDYTANRFGTKEIEITDAFILNDKGKPTLTVRGNEDITIEICYKVNKNLPECVFGIGIYNIDGVLCYGNNTQLDRIKVENPKGIGKIMCHVNKLPLLSGTYKLNVAVVDENGRPLDFIRYYMDFNVVSEDRSVGIFTMAHNWEV